MNAPSLRMLALKEPDPTTSRESQGQTRRGAQLIIACEDNRAFLRSLPDESMKLIVTSPPYNLGKRYETRAPLDVYVGAQRCVIDECVRLLHPCGSICWQVGNYVENGEIIPLDSILYPVFHGQGLKLRNRIVWHFGHGLHCTRRLSGRYETINWWTKGHSYTWTLDEIKSAVKVPEQTALQGPQRRKAVGKPEMKEPE